MMPNEIITLQLGNYSNYVGTHWWNIQESSFTYNEEETAHSEINHDILFREGCNFRGEVTFTPRLIFTDLSGSLGSLPVHGTLYGSKNYRKDEGHFMWGGDVEVHQSSSEPRNQFLQDLHEEDKLYENESSRNVETLALNGHCEDRRFENNRTNVNGHSTVPTLYDLDKQINTWTDFKRLHFHPHSAILLNQHLQNSDTFCSWITGVNESKGGNAMSKFEETIRFYAEECDYMQGFHILSDINNGFGGLTCSLLEHIHDEFSGKTKVVFPVGAHSRRVGRTPTKAREQTVSTILALSGFLENSSLVCPLSLNTDILDVTQDTRDFPHLIYDASSSYHTSAILAASLEAATRGYRLKTNPISMSHLTAGLTSGNRKIVGLSCALPLPYVVEKYECFPDFLCDFADKNPWSPITPSMGDGKSTDSLEHCFSRAVSLNGLHQSKTTASSNHLQYNHTQLHQCRDATSVIKLYLEERFPMSTNLISVMNERINVSTPFPHIFSNRVGHNGFIKLNTNRSPTNFTDPYTDHLLTDTGNFSKSPREKLSKQLDGALFSCNEDFHSKVYNVESVPVITSMSSSNLLVPMFNRCHTQGTVLKRWVSQYRHSDASTEYNALEEAVETFRTLEQDYSILRDHDSDFSD